MRLYIDSANIHKIAYLNEYFPIAGVTTNPSILVREKQPYLDLLKEILNVTGNKKELFVQVIGDQAEEMIDEARFILNHLHGNVIIKVPVTNEGIKAIKILSADNIKTLATAIYTPFQGLVAALAGANYVAPYVNRIDNLPGDGVKVVSETASLFSKHNLTTEIIAASFKNVQQILDACLAGTQNITASPDLIEKLIAHPSTSTDIANFRADWQKAYGMDQKTIINRPVK
ncbi:MAG: transaldolase family protein [Thermoactinomyces sp.]